MSHDYKAFVTIVQQEARVTFEDAARITRAVLGVLADHIARGEAQDLAEELPDELAPALNGSVDAQGFSAEEFIARIAKADGVDPETAERYVAAVFDAIGRTISDEEYDDLVAELSADYAPLLPEGPDVRIVSYDTFLQLVTEHAPVDRETARRATVAVLEVLAQRISGGEVEDLITHLPRELRGALRRGMQETGGKPRRMSLDEFLERVAAREGIAPFTARDNVHAVFVALRDAVGDREFFDATSQLPTEFQALLVG